MDEQLMGDLAQRLRSHAARAAACERALALTGRVENLHQDRAEALERVRTAGDLAALDVARARLDAVDDALAQARDELAIARAGAR